MALKFDQNHSLSYGYYRCQECGNEFYGGGPAIHNSGCSQKDYSSCDYVFGPKHIDQVKTSASSFGDDHKCYGISLNDLRREFPDLL